MSEYVVSLVIGEVLAPETSITNNNNNNENGHRRTNINLNNFNKIFSSCNNKQIVTYLFSTILKFCYDEREFLINILIFLLNDSKVNFIY